ncbi:hypothetical protein ACJZ2D_001100 [Fusarium nematophilum]
MPGEKPSPFPTAAQPPKKKPKGDPWSHEYHVEVEEFYLNRAVSSFKEMKRLEASRDHDLESAAKHRKKALELAPASDGATTAQLEGLYNEVLVRNGMTPTDEATTTEKATEEVGGSETLGWPEKPKKAGQHQKGEKDE